MTPRFKLPDRIIRAVEITGVRLVDGVVKSKIAALADIGDADFVVDWYARVARHDRDAGVFVVVASVDARVVRSDAGGGRPLVLIRAAHELAYSLPKELKVSSRELNAFAKTNAIFNAWPYWREFIQSTFARMDLPQPVLGVYRIPSGPAEKSRSQGRRDGGTDHGAGVQETGAAAQGKRS
jgi:hypothetical protein